MLYFTVGEVRGRRYLYGYYPNAAADLHPTDLKGFHFYLVRLGQLPHENFGNLLYRVINTLSDEGSLKSLVLRCCPEVMVLHQMLSRQPSPFYQKFRAKLRKRKVHFQIKEQEVEPRLDLLMESLSATHGMSVPLSETIKCQDERVQLQRYHFVAHTDGSFDPHSRTGGYGAVIKHLLSQNVQHLEGGLLDVTPQVTEVNAIYEVIDTLPSLCACLVATDYEPILRVFRKRQLPKDPRFQQAVRDLILLTEQKQIQLDLTHVKAHDGMLANEFAHVLAHGALKSTLEAVRILEAT